jgi:hypothetical protein
LRCCFRLVAAMLTSTTPMDSSEPCACRRWRCRQRWR